MLSRAAAGWCDGAAYRGGGRRRARNARNSRRARCVCACVSVCVCVRARARVPRRGTYKCGVARFAVICLRGAGGAVGAVKAPVRWSFTREDSTAFEEAVRSSRLVDVPDKVWPPVQFPTTHTHAHTHTHTHRYTNTQSHTHVTHTSYTTAILTRTHSYTYNADARCLTLVPTGWHDAAHDFVPPWAPQCRGPAAGVRRKPNRGERGTRARCCECACVPPRPRPRARVQEGWTAMMIAADNRHPEAALAVADAGGDVDAKNEVLLCRGHARAALSWRGVRVSPRMCERRVFVLMCRSAS